MKKINLFLLAALLTIGGTASVSLATNSKQKAGEDCYTIEANVNQPGQSPDAFQVDCDKVEEVPCCFISDGHGGALTVWQRAE